MILVTALGVTGSGLVAQGRGTAPPSAAQELRRQQAEALRNGGVEAAASITGHYTGPARAFWTAGDPFSIKEVSDFSHTAVVGRSFTNESQLTADGRSIVMLYHVEIESSVKGAHKRGDRIVVNIPGGKIRFASGAVAEMQLADMIRPQPQTRYVWFLRRAPANLTQGGDDSSKGASYVPTFGPLGIYALEGGTSFKRVIPLGAYRSRLAMHLIKNPRTVAEFLTEVAAAGQR
ncbi:MAG: hypothetical protein M3R55_04175 [Acidobacteriota bacterium]|nr:hypothetical protein [Acidobacteriota bacterium]